MYILSYRKNDVLFFIAYIVDRFNWSILLARSPAWDERNSTLPLVARAGPLDLSKVYSPSTDGCKNWCSFPFSPIQLSNDFTSEVSRARKKWQSGFLFSSLSFSSLFFLLFFLMFYYNWLRGQDLVRDFIIRESGCPFHLGGIRVVGKSFWNMWMAGIAVWYKHEWTFR